MLEHFIKAAKFLDIDVDQVYADCVKSSLEAEKREQLKESKKKMKREMK